MSLRIRTYDGTNWLGISTPIVPETRIATDWPFTADAWCNVPIGYDAVYGSPGDTLTQAIRGGITVSCAGTSKSISTGMNLNATYWSVPVNIAAVSDPTWTCQELDVSTGQIANTFTIQAPDPILVSGELTQAIQGQSVNPDSAMVILASDGVTSDEIYKWGWPTQTTQRQVYTRYGRHQTFNLKTDAGYRSDHQAIRAAGVPVLAGLIRAWEIQRAVADPTTAIRHALAIALQSQQYVRASRNSGVGYRWPAWSNDYMGDRAIQVVTPPTSGTFTISGGSNSYIAVYNVTVSTLQTAIAAWGGDYSGVSVSGTAGSSYNITIAGAGANTLTTTGASITKPGTLYADSGVVMGQLIALDPALDITTLGLSTTLGMAMAYTLRDYGGYAVDSSGTMTCYAEVGAASLFSASNVVGDLAIIRTHLLPVVNATQNNPGGGGAPRRAVAPAFA